MKGSRRVRLRAYSVAVLSAVLIGALLVPSQAGTSALLDELTIFAGNDSPVTTSFNLVANKKYTLILTREVVYTDASGVAKTYDSVYGGYTSTSSFSAFEHTLLQHRFGNGTWVANPLPGQGILGAPPYCCDDPADPDSPEHRYTWDFISSTNQTMSYRAAPKCAEAACDATGSWRIEIHGPPPPPDPDTTTVNEPKPGKISKVVSSDPLPKSGGRVTINVTQSKGDLSGTAIATEGGRKKKPQTKKQKEADVLESFFMCLVVDDKPEDVFDEFLDEADKDVFKSLIGESPEGRDFCLVFILLLLLGESGDQASSRASAHMLSHAALGTDPGCGVERLPLLLTTRKGKITKVKHAKNAPTAWAPRATCSSDAPGEIDIKVKHGRKTSLRKAVGKRLDLGAVRDPDAKATNAKLSFHLD